MPTEGKAVYRSSLIIIIIIIIKALVHARLVEVQKLRV